MSLGEITNSESDVNLLGIKNKPRMPEDEARISQENLVSSTNMTEDHNIIIVEESSDPRSITVILNICKQKILKPYMRFLSLMGFRPLFGDSREPKCVKEILNVGYTIQVVIFLILGYILQYIACFRRDRGFGRIPKSRVLTETQVKTIYEETCNGSLVSNFIIPTLLHFAGYIYALIVFRKSDDDELPVLIERVFLTSSHIPSMQENQRQIVRTLWFFLIGSFVWMLSSIGCIGYMMTEGEITLKWLENSPYEVQVTSKILLIIGIIWHDIVQASVISNYCLQTQLLKSYVYFLKEKLLQQPVRPLEWIRDLEEFKKLLSYLNEEIAPPVCFFTVINWTYAISGTLWLFGSDNYSPNPNQPLSTAVSVLSVILWWLIAIAPFIQAAKLTTACENVKTVGQEVRTRPFAHQDTPVYEINSILIYTTSLKINARLFNLPINGKYIGIVFAIAAVYILVLGQSYYLHM